MMDLRDILETLKKQMRFKSTTSPGDIILVGMKTGLVYGVVQSIEQNVKKNWYNFNCKLLSIPAVDISWILRVPQMTGEIFTINDEEHFIIAVDTNRFAEKTELKNTKQKKSVGSQLKLVKTNSTKSKNS